MSTVIDKGRTPSPDIPPGTWVEESATGYRVLFVSHEGEVDDVTRNQMPGQPTRYFRVAEMLERNEHV